MGGHARQLSTDTELSEIEAAESAPLLKDSVPDVEDDRPLPWGQMLTLLWMRFTEPICFFVIFPFIPQLCRDLGVAKSDEQAGYYAGLVESAFAATQFLFTVHWGRTSDRIGRKPCLLFGLAGSALSVLFFGFSKTFTMLIVARCIAGAMNANVSIIRAMTGEITTRKNRARAFSILPIAPGAGGSLGPIIGGYFSKPADNFPKYFDQPFWRTYPYLLPCIIASVIPFSAFILASIVLKETLPPEKRSTKEAKLAAKSSLISLLSPSINAILVSYSLFMFCNTAALALLPLYAFTPKAKHGLGLSSAETGALFGIRGVAICLVQFCCFPWLERRFSARSVFRWCSFLFIIIYTLYPLLGTLNAAEQPWTLKIGLWLTMLLWSGVNMCHSSMGVLTTEAAASPSVLATTNSLVQLCSAAVRVFSPTIASSLFAASVDKNLLNGNLIWIVMVVASVFTFASSFFLHTFGPSHDIRKSKEPDQQSLLPARA